MAAFDNTGEIVLLVTPPTWFCCSSYTRCAGKGERVVFQPQGDDLLRDLAPGMHPRNYFLPEVAPLGEADGSGELAGFGREDGVVEVDPEKRAAAFDPAGVEGRPPHRPQRPAAHLGRLA